MSQSILKGLKPEKQLKNISFLKETCEQVNKDLAGFSTLQITLTDELLENPISSLISQVLPIIKNLEQANNLQPFIYKVDLSENKYIDYKLERISKTQFSEDIIKRSAQKVFLRWHFSNRLNH